MSCPVILEYARASSPMFVKCLSDKLLWAIKQWTRGGTHFIRHLFKRRRDKSICLSKLRIIIMSLLITFNIWKRFFRRGRISNFPFCARMQHVRVHLRLSHLNNESRKMSPCDLTWSLMCGHFWSNSNSAALLVFKTSISASGNQKRAPGAHSRQLSVFNETPERSLVMPQIASFRDSAHLWCLNDKSSRVHIYATWSKVRKRRSKASVLFENSVSRCELGKRCRKARPRGHGESTAGPPLLLFRFLCSHHPLYLLNVIYALWMEQDTPAVQPGRAVNVDTVVTSKGCEWQSRLCAGPDRAGIILGLPLCLIIGARWGGEARSYYKLGALQASGAGWSPSHLWWSEKKFRLKGQDNLCNAAAVCPPLCCATLL